MVAFNAHLARREKERERERERRAQTESKGDLRPSCGKEAELERKEEREGRVVT
jgi:hypothetical protein